MNWRISALAMILKRRQVHEKHEIHEKINGLWCLSTHLSGAAHWDDNCLKFFVIFVYFVDELVFLG